MRRTVCLLVVICVIVAAAVLPAFAQVGEDLGDGLEVARKTLWQQIRQGGIIMIPIGLCSIAMVIFIVEQLLKFNRKKFLPDALVQSVGEAIDAKDLQRAYDVCDQNQMFFTKLIKAGLEKAHLRQEPVIRQAIEDAASRESEELQVANGYLSVVSVVSPMLGLFGTVLGMIRSFNDIAYAGALGKPTLLAEGVGQALVTTAAGLFVGIPAMVFYLYFRMHIRKLLVDVEKVTMDLVERMLKEQGQ